MKTRLFTLAGALAIISVLGHFFAKPLLAQVRAALIQNVDEPARNPIALNILGDATFAGAPGTVTVPLGKRYVIEAFTGQCAVASPNNLSSIVVTTTAGAVLPGAFQNQAQAWAPGFFLSSGEWFANSTTRLYADPGSTVTASAYASNSFPKSCSYWLSGYAVNLP